MSTPSSPIDHALQWSSAGRKVAVATVIETWGSAPQPVGSQLVIDQDGNFEGSVSGGCVEGAVITEAIEVIARRQVEPARIRRRRRDCLAGRPCLRRPHPRLCRTGRAQLMRRSDIQRLAEARSARRPLAMLTWLRSGESAPRCSRRGDRAAGAGDRRRRWLSPRPEWHRPTRRRRRSIRHHPQSAAADDPGRRRPHFAGAHSAGAGRRLRCRGDRSAHCVRDRRAVRGRYDRRPLAGRGVARDRCRSAHRFRRSHPRSQDRRSGARPSRSPATRSMSAHSVPRRPARHGASGWSNRRCRKRPSPAFTGRSASTLAPPARRKSPSRSWQK